MRLAKQLGKGGISIKKMHAVFLGLALFWGITAPAYGKVLKDGYITRDLMVAIAHAYASFLWYPTTDNICHSSKCGKFVDTPDRDTYKGWPQSKGWKANEENIGVPYQWGGFSSLPDNYIPGFSFVHPKDFVDEYRNRKFCAGDKDWNAESGAWCACGVDCSGFVSRCWNLWQKQGGGDFLTNTSVAWPITYDQLRKGDVLARPGHVMLFISFMDPDKTKMLVAEASSRDWKVSERICDVVAISASSDAVTLKIDGHVETYELRTYNPIKFGLVWLRSRQNQNGSWLDNVGITSMIALAYINEGYKDDPVVTSAIQYILSKQKDDGSFGSVYETATAVWALVSTHNSAFHNSINAAKEWLLAVQCDESEGVGPEHPCYGGWRYGAGQVDGDLSNTQFALMALDAAYAELGLKKPSPEDPAGWAYKAIKFVSRCQNRPASNDQLWAQDQTRPSYNDGGFIYHPMGWSLAGGTKSYGSMTAAGIWSLRLCGVPEGDPRIQAALCWLRNNEDCAFDDNPGHPYGESHLLYDPCKGVSDVSELRHIKLSQMVRGFSKVVIEGTKG